MPVRIKICGITNLEDAKVAIHLGVDALGFIFTRKSPRYISPADASAIIKKLPPFVSKVGVFVNESLETIALDAKTASIDTVQLHGNESPEFCMNVPFPVIKAFAIEPSFDVYCLADYDVAGFLLDTWHPEKYGGTGQSFDWTIAQKACTMHQNVIIAGGLGPTNIREALETLNPFGIDVSSGVEIRPGVKNPHKMRELVTLVRNWKSFDHRSPGT